jgi:hypothetical protein
MDIMTGTPVHKGRHISPVGSMAHMQIKAYDTYAVPYSQQQCAYFHDDIPHNNLQIYDFS